MTCKLCLPACIVRDLRVNRVLFPQRLCKNTGLGVQLLRTFESFAVLQ